MSKETLSDSLDLIVKSYPGGIPAINVIHINMKKDRPMSWSQISSFEYDPEQWYQVYVLGEKGEPSGAMKFGKKIGDKYLYEKTFQREYKITGKIGNIPLIGFIDAFDLENKKLIELKTGRNWDLKKAQTHGQIDLYCAMLWTMHKIHPAELDIKLIWLATEETGDFSTQFVKDMKPVIFPIKKTMLDVLNMLARVKRVKAQMESYKQSHS